MDRKRKTEHYCRSVYFSLFVNFTLLLNQRRCNILSGNYCQPKCAEPWIKVKFENEKQGKVQVVASPLIHLTNKPNATTEDFGEPEKVIVSLGPFVTGNSYD